jgi:hypothetical protein
MCTGQTTRGSRKKTKKLTPCEEDDEEELDEEEGDD